jgi:hypothetical protein
LNLCPHLAGMKPGDRNSATKLSKRRAYNR